MPETYLNSPLLRFHIKPFVYIEYTSLKAVPPGVTPNNLIDADDTPNDGFALLQALKRMYGRENLEHYSTVEKQA